MHTFAGSGRVAAAWLACVLALAAPARAEDGYDLWLRYRLIANASRLADVRTHGTAVDQVDGRIETKRVGSRCHRASMLTR